jgi:predicted lipid-binding transport protein (Tim44 family)
MAHAQALREMVERIVREALDAHRSTLTSQIVNTACVELEPLLATTATAPSPVSTARAGVPEETPAGGMPTDLLNAAFCTVMDSQSQSDILVALLDGAAKFSQRSALFVVKAGLAVGWRARGFSNNDAIKTIHFDPNSGFAGRAYNDRQSVQAAAAEFDPGFISTFGEPLVGTNAMILPLLIRDKVAALLYADGGASGSMDPSALECLTRGASLWLEIVAARKSGAPAAAPEPPPAPEPVSEDARTGTQKIAAVSDTPAPPPAPAYAAPAPQPQAAAAVAAAMAAAPEDEEVHRKAKRFAKLLVDEIKLYNQQKVAEGRANRDLYRRLKDDIDKSRASWDKRYGQTTAAAANYFSEELIRILCDGDSSLMGSGFSG